MLETLVVLLGVLLAIAVIGLLLISGQLATERKKAEVMHKNLAIDEVYREIDRTRDDLARQIEDLRAEFEAATEVV